MPKLLRRALKVTPSKRGPVRVRPKQRLTMVNFRDLDRTACFDARSLRPRTNRYALVLFHTRAGSPCLLLRVNTSAAGRGACAEVAALAHEIDFDLEVALRHRAERPLMPAGAP